MATNMTADVWWAHSVRLHGAGFVAARAKAEHDRNAAKPWVVLAYRRTFEAIYKFQIVAGYNRWTGEDISWRVPSLNDSENYDLSNAIEVS